MAMIIDGNAVATSMEAIASAGGGVIDVPAGTWTGFFDVACSNVHFRGVSSRASILQFASGGGAENYIIRSSGATWRRQIRFSDIGFDAINAAFAVAAQGYNADEWIFERCRFYNFPLGHGFNGHELRKCRFIDCEFLSAGDSAGVGVLMGSGYYDWRFERCFFNWHRNGILGDTGTDGSTVGSRIVVDQCNFRFDYWLVKAHANANATGSGAGVTYTGTNDVVLTDPSKDFTAIPFDNSRVIRAMPILASGTTTNVGMTQLRDSTKNFAALGMSYGDVIRTATAWSMVVGVDPLIPTDLLIDGWRDLTTYDDVASPGIGTAYTIYKIILGETRVVAATTISTDRWRTLDGTTITTIPDGTRYEILVDYDAGALHFEHGISSAIVSNSFFSGGRADNCTIRGPNSLLVGTSIRNGQDTGVTIGPSAAGTRVLGCMIRQCGSANIIVDSTDGVEVADCSLGDGGTEYFVADIGADVSLYATTRCVVHDNRMVRTSNPRGFYGVRLAGGCIDTRVYNNLIRGHLNGQFQRIDDTGTRLFNNDR